MNLRKTLLAVILMLSVLPGLAGCGGPSTPIVASQIVQRTLTALGKVTTFTLDSDVINTYKVGLASTPNVTTSEWKGTRTVDLPSHSMKLDMTITGSVSMKVERYVTGGWDYLQALSPGLSHGGSPWTRNPVNDQQWTRDAQLPYYVELLKGVGDVTLSGSYTINGTACYVLSITPPAGVMVDWVTGQEQPVGPQLDIMYGGGVPVVRADAYRGGTVLLWIDKSTFLPVGARIEADFAGDVGGGLDSAVTPTTNPVDSGFQGTMMFSNYNRPVTVDVPAAASGLK